MFLFNMDAFDLKGRDVEFEVCLSPFTSLWRWKSNVGFQMWKSNVGFHSLYETSIYEHLSKLKEKRKRKESKRDRDVHASLT